MKTHLPWKESPREKIYFMNMVQDKLRLDSQTLVTSARNRMADFTDRRRLKNDEPRSNRTNYY